MAVTAIQISSRRPLAGGAAFGDAGPYEEVRGTLRFAVDPGRPDLQVITDIGLAPVEADGRVYFSSEFVLLKPERPRSSSPLLFDVANRGNRTALNAFNDVDADRVGPVADVGTGFLMRRGFSVVCCGWQHDVPGGLAITVPEARQNGTRLSGQAYIQYQLNRPAAALLLSDAGHRPLPAADLNDPRASLTVRDHPDAPPRTIPRAEWRFARAVDGQVVEDPTHVYLSGGFQPGLVYEIIYTTTGAPVIGLGFLAMRDCVSFLKYGSRADGNPCAESLTRAYGFGRSQSGRFLREFCYLGLNLDDQGRMVFDGMLIHTGSSRRGEFNIRFGQPSTNILRSPSTLFPMTYTEQVDPETGARGGLLSRLQERGAVPRIMATNTGVEYWWSGASLAHTEVDGSADIEPPPTVRIYHLAGTQHGQGSLPLSDRTADGSRLQYPLNTVDYRPLLRAALIHLEDWVRSGKEPLPSRYPRVADGTAVPREALASRFESIPGVRLPKALPQRRRLDFGPGAAGGVLEYPPEEGSAYGVRVSAVDEDGNEVAGVRPLDLRVPLATYTGWTLRHEEIGGAGHFIPLLGATHGFPRTPAERAARNDPRPSIAERYPSRDAYLAQARRAAAEMVAEGSLLEEDVDHVIAQAAARYDAFTAGNGPDD